MPTAQKLDVYRDHALVGTLWNERPLRFVYAAEWVQQHHASLSPQLPITQTTHSGATVESFFENLLPEAGIRELLKLKHQVTSTFGLLRVIGGDTASDLTMLLEGETPQAPEYQAVTWHDIAEAFTQQQGLIYSIEEEHGRRISLAGAQRKLSIHIDHAGNPLLPLGNAPSTYIVKPDIKGIEGVWASAINETYTMMLANQLGLGVAAASYQPIAKACVIKRYDRTVDTQGRIRRLHQLDLCQIDGKLSTIKYESDGGPTLLRCREMLKECGVTAADTKRFIQWLFFNLYVGNHDSHAKNLSIYYSSDGDIRLAPFYDLLSTTLYPSLSRKFAFNLGGENQISNLHQEQITAMAKSLNFKPSYVLGIAEEISHKLLGHLTGVSEQMNAIAIPGSEQTMVERLHQHIESNTLQLQRRLFTKQR